MRLKTLTLALAVILGAGLLGACDDDDGGGPSQAQESERRQDTYDSLVAAQPANTMAYSPSRDTINFWIETWDAEAKLSFVYLVAANGQKTGYYVFKGLPITLCASLTPTYEKTRLDLGERDGQAIVPAPGVDGVYYSGGQCDMYYGEDATTGAFIGFTLGGSLNMQVMDEPLPLPDVEPLGFTSIEDVT